MAVRFFGGGILYRTHLVVSGYSGGISSTIQRFPQSRDPILFIFGPQNLLWSLDVVGAHDTEQTHRNQNGLSGSAAHFLGTCSLHASALPPPPALSGRVKGGRRVARCLRAGLGGRPRACALCCSAPCASLCACVWRARLG